MEVGGTQLHKSVHGKDTGKFDQMAAPRRSVECLVLVFRRFRGPSLPDAQHGNQSGKQVFSPASPTCTSASFIVCSS